MIEYLTLAVGIAIGFLIGICLMESSFIKWMNKALKEKGIRYKIVTSTQGKKVDLIPDDEE